MFKKYKKFTVTALFSIAFTVFLAYNIGLILFGDNSFQVYKSLKHKKEYLQNKIQELQKNNAYLQKEYFELKNLEPEQ